MSNAVSKSISKEDVKCLEMDILHLKNKFRAPISRNIEDINLHSTGKCKNFIDMHYFLHLHLWVSLTQIHMSG